jgi:ribosome-associated protein
MEQVKILVEKITKGIQEKKGSNITIADLSGIEGSICRYFVICQGNSPAQVEAITDSVEETARIEAGEKPVHIVGLTHAQWVAMDYTDVMVHVFLPETREYYNLENLWEDAKLTRLPDVD